MRCEICGHAANPLHRFADAFVCAGCFDARQQFARILDESEVAFDADGRLFFGRATATVRGERRITPLILAYSRAGPAEPDGMRLRALLAEKRAGGAA